MLNTRIVPETVYEKINGLSQKCGNMDEFVTTTDITDVVRYARISQDPNHIRFLCKHPNVCVLLEIAERQDKKATDLSRHLLLNNINKPELLKALIKNPKNNLSGFISWLELSEKTHLESNKINPWKLWVKYQGLVANHPLAALSKIEKVIG